MRTPHLCNALLLTVAGLIAGHLAATNCEASMFKNKRFSASRSQAELHKKKVSRARAGQEMVKFIEAKNGKRRWFKRRKMSRSTLAKNVRTVRTTAYTHTESDHIRYQRKNAIGTTLKYGQVRSAAADWSIFPLGTKFQIDGDPSIYIVEDYGSALVGKPTIDLYKPSKRSMRAWGVRHVNIRVLEWGSFEQSLKWLSERSRYWHVRQMARDIKAKIQKV